MRLWSRDGTWIIGKGWRVGPLTKETAIAKIDYVIAALIWSARTKK